MNINAVLAGYPEPHADTFDGYIPGLEFENVIVKISDTAVELKNERLASGSILQICIRKLQNEAVNPEPSRIKTICYIKAMDYTPKTLWAEIFKSGFRFTANEWYAISVSAVSPYGMKSPYLMYITQAIA